MLRRALSIRRDRLGTDHADYARCLANLADLLVATMRIDEARNAYERSMEILSDKLGAGSETVIVLRAKLRQLSKHESAES